LPRIEGALQRPCVIVLASNFWIMRDWTERTGVYDDICYLRQAHLFQRFGLGDQPRSPIC